MEQPCFIGWCLRLMVKSSTGQWFKSHQGHRWCQVGHPTTIHSVHHQISHKTRSEQVQFRVSHSVWRLRTNVNFYSDQTPLRKLFSDPWFTGRSWIFGIGNVNMLLSFDSRMLGGMWWMTCLFSPGSCFNFLWYCDLWQLKTLPRPGWYDGEF